MPDADLENETADRPREMRGKTTGPGGLRGRHESLSEPPPWDIQGSHPLSLLASATTRIVARLIAHSLAALGMEFVPVYPQLERNPFQGSLSKNPSITMVTLYPRNSSLVGAAGT